MFKFLGRPVGARRLTIIAAALAGLVLLGFNLFPFEPGIPPQQAIGEALDTTRRARSYEYSIKKYTVIDGREQLDSDVTGERESETRIHIKGQIFGSELDFYQIDTTSYSRDQLTGEWIEIMDNQLNQQEIFMGELNPLANFGYKELTKAEFAGTEKVNGEKYWIFKAWPVISNPYMEILWKDFTYKFWVEPRSYRIYKAQITAVSKNDASDTLNLLLEFCRYNENIKIKPPQ